MEVLNLEVCHFVQYRPDKGLFDPPQMEVTIVKRDRTWFEKYLKVFENFIIELNTAREQIQAGEIPQSLNALPTNKKRKIKSDIVTDCIIAQDLYE
tara:strand:+ start:1086 stop:1373 length:288 start_codon:yes stop_codon:yes gene_type:complete